MFDLIPNSCSTLLRGCCQGLLVRYRRDEISGSLAIKTKFFCFVGVCEGTESGIARCKGATSGIAICKAKKSRQCRSIPRSERIPRIHAVLNAETMWHGDR